MLMVSFFASMLHVCCLCDSVAAPAFFLAARFHLCFGSPSRPMICVNHFHRPLGLILILGNGLASQALDHCGCGLPRVCPPRSGFCHWPNAWWGVVMLPEAQRACPGSVTAVCGHSRTPRPDPTVADFPTAVFYFACRRTRLWTDCVAVRAPLLPARPPFG